MGTKTKCQVGTEVYSATGTLDFCPSFWRFQSLIFYSVLLCILANHFNSDFERAYIRRGEAAEAKARENWLYFTVKHATISPKCS